jgi:hypothetical protein
MTRLRGSFCCFKVAVLKCQAFTAGKSELAFFQAGKHFGGGHCSQTPSHIGNSVTDSDPPPSKCLSCRKRLFAGRAGVHVDFHADRHFDDFRGLPGHFRSPSQVGTTFAPTPNLMQFKKFASAYFALKNNLFCVALQNKRALSPGGLGGKMKALQWFRSVRRHLLDRSGS